MGLHNHGADFYRKLQKVFIKLTDNCGWIFHQIGHFCQQRWRNRNISANFRGTFFDLCLDNRLSFFGIDTNESRIHSLQILGSVFYRDRLWMQNAMAVGNAIARNLFGTIFQDDR